MTSSKQERISVRNSVELTEAPLNVKVQNIPSNVTTFTY
jgi:hypothetical protein